MLLTAFGVVLTLYGFIEIVEETREGDIQPFDEWLLRRLRREGDPAVPIGPSWLAQMVMDITALGGIAVLVIVILFAIG